MPRLIAKSTEFPGYRDSGQYTNAIFLPNYDGIAAPDLIKKPTEFGGY